MDQAALGSGTLHMDGAPLFLKGVNGGGGQCGRLFAKKAQTVVVGLLYLRLDERLACVVKGVGAHGNALALADALQVGEVILQQELGVGDQTEAAVAETDATEAAVEESTAPAEDPGLKNVTLKLKKTDVQLGVYYQFQLQLDCELNPEDVTWTSEHPHIATVDEQDDIMMITDQGTIVRTPVADINIYSRTASGVIVMRLSEGQKLVTFTKVAREDEAEAEAENLPETDEELTEITDETVTEEETIEENE